MKVQVRATGSLKQFVPKLTEMDIESQTTLNELKNICQIPSTSICAYMVNGKIEKGNYIIDVNDLVVLLNIVGAG